MTLEEIFSKLVSHMVKGLMVHTQLAEYFAFLGLRGFQYEQEHHYIEETKSYRKIFDHYISQFNKLIDESKVDNPNLIPKNWYNVTRFDIDTVTKRKSIKNGFEEWKKWEIETKELYGSFCKEVSLNDDIPSRLFLEELIENVNREIIIINERIIELEDVEYDLVYINDLQKELEDEYYKN